MLSERKLHKLFERRDVAEMRGVLRQNDVVDVNDLSVLTRLFARSVLSFGIEYFRPDVMRCLLNDFDADLNAVCVSDAEGADWHPLDIAYCTPHIPEDAVEWVLDHHASPFLVKGCDEFEDRWNGQRCLIERARDRLRTAWAAAWALSQHPVWRDMAQQVAQCIMGTPVREFLDSQEDSRKKLKI